MKTNWTQALAESELEHLYEERSKFSIISEEYETLTSRIKEESSTIKHLAEADASSKAKQKINWEPWIGAGLGVLGNLTLAVLSMHFQEKGHLPDFKLMSLFKSRV